MAVIYLYNACKHFSFLSFWLYFSFNIVHSDLKYPGYSAAKFPARIGIKSSFMLRIQRCSSCLSAGNQHSTVKSQNTHQSNKATKKCLFPDKLLYVSFSVILILNLSPRTATFIFCHWIPEIL